MASSPRSVLITGCSAGGIGHALAKEFHAQGHRVIATARQMSSMVVLSDLGIECYELDVTDENAIVRLKNVLVNVLDGKLDVLVNNAGVCALVNYDRGMPRFISSHIAYHGAALDTSLEAAKHVFDVNFFGVMLMVQSFTPMLIEAASLSSTPSLVSRLPYSTWLPFSWTGMVGGRGIIVNIGSINSILPTPFCSVYNASKAALNHYSNCLRLELAPFKVKVLHVITGGVKTNIVRPNLPPSGSVYESMRKDYENLRSAMKTDEQTPAEEYAKALVSEALRPFPHAWFYEAKFSWSVWFGYTFGPQTFFDSMLSNNFGLTRFAKERIRQKEKTD